jgi:hypothetical protein
MKRAAFLLPLFLIAAAAVESPKKVCVVGQVTFDDYDLVRRQAVVEVYYPGRGEPYTALAQLIEGGLAVEIIRGLGHSVDSVTLETEAHRIDTETHAPERLAHIKEAYGDDRAAYLKGFVAPAYARRVLYHEVFQKSRGGEPRVPSSTASEPKEPSSTARDYDTWFWTQAARIPVTIVNPELRQSFIERVNWSHQLQLVPREVR